MVAAPVVIRRVPSHCHMSGCEVMIHVARAIQATEAVVNHAKRPVACPPATLCLAGVTLMRHRRTVGNAAFNVKVMTQSIAHD